MRSILRMHVLQKRGGSSGGGGGGGGGGASVADQSKGSKTSLIPASEKELTTGLKEWESELKYIKTAKSDQEDEDGLNVFSESKKTVESVGEASKYRGVDKTSLNIAQSAAKSVLDAADFDPKSVIAVKDSKGKIQAAANFSMSGDGSILLSSVARAPWNVATKDSRSVKGSVTSVLVEAVKKAKQSGGTGEVVLPVNRANKSFFEKAGFKETTSSSLQPMMRLSAKDADNFLKKNS